MRPPWTNHLAGVLRTLGCTAAAGVMSIWFAPTNLAMVYLLGVVFAAPRIDRRASVVAAVLGTLEFDFFFIPPIYTFAIGDTQYLLTAIVLLTVGFVARSLTAGARRQARAASPRERRTAVLYAVTRELSVAVSLEDIGEVAAARPTRWHSQGLASLFVLLPGQFACAIPLAPRRLACQPQGIECPWHDRTAVITNYAVFAAVIAAVVVVVWLRAASGKPGRKARRMRGAK
jgi:K+-sensing histidine kinase KdpD